MGRAPAFLRGSREGLWRAWGGWCGAEPLKVWSLTRSCPQSTSIEAVRQSSRSAPALAMELARRHRKPIGLQFGTEHLGGEGSPLPVITDHHSKQEARVPYRSCWPVCPG